MELEQKIVEYLQKTESLIVEEAPAFIQEAINFYFYKEMAAVVSSLFFLLLILSIGFFTLSKKFKTMLSYLVDTDEDDSGLKPISTIISLFAFGISFVPLFICYYHTILLIQIYVAPKLYLVEKFMT